jgi:hypothetical protein
VSTAALGLNATPSLGPSDSVTDDTLDHFLSILTNGRVTADES